MNALMVAVRYAVGDEYYDAPGTVRRDALSSYQCLFTPGGMDYRVSSGEIPLGGKQRRVYYVTLSLNAPRCGSELMLLDDAVHYVISEEGEILRRLDPAEVAGITSTPMPPPPPAEEGMQPKPAPEKPAIPPVTATEPAPPPAVQPPQKAGSEYSEYRARRERIEKLIADDPTVLKRIDGVLALYEQVHRDTYDIEARYKAIEKKRHPSQAEVNARLRDAEVFERTATLVNSLHDKLF